MLFNEGPDVRCVWNDENRELQIFVDNTLKAEAISQLLPIEKTFGNVKMHITVIPSNTSVSKSDLFKAAFAGNPIVSFTEHIDTMSNNPMDFIVFEKEVVQYFDDNLGDLYGVRSTLYQDLANEVFEDHDGVFFCTDIDDTDVCRAFEEWS